MTERPILFSAPMIRAILEGRKTMTRRLLKPQPRGHTAWQDDDTEDWWVSGHEEDTMLHLPWAPGGRLWVREAWRTLQAWDGDPPRRIRADIDKIDYASDGFPRNPLWAWGKTRPAIHAPRWASRITLLVTAIRVERLQDISEADAMAEGCYPQEGEKPRFHDAISAFAYWWDNVHGEDAWAENPWVSATTFERVMP